MIDSFWLTIAVQTDHKGDLSNRQEIHSSRKFMGSTMAVVELRNYVFIDSIVFHKLIYIKVNYL